MEELSRPDDPLVILIELEKRARSALQTNELEFIFVNETQNLVSYRQAILFSKNGTPIRISGIATMEGGSPFVNWLRKIISPVVLKTVGVERITSEDIEFCLRRPPWHIIVDA